MRNQFRNVLFVFAAFIAGAVCLRALLHTKEPQYEGRPLSYWAKAWVKHREPKTPDALNAIGSAAVPYLIEWISYEPPLWIKWVDNFSHRIGWKVGSGWFKGENDWKSGTFVMFGMLGTNRVFAVQPLERLLTNQPDGHTRFSAALGLGAIGAPAIPVVKSAMTNSDVSVRYCALTAIQTMDSNSVAFLPDLKNATNDVDPQVASAAFELLHLIELSAGISASP